MTITIEPVSHAKRTLNALSVKLEHFRAVGPADAEFLDAILQRNQRTTKAGARLVEQGMPQMEISVILDGWAARQKVMRDGERQIVAFHLPGDVCEFNALLGASADTETIALGPVRSATISRGMLNELAARPKLTRGLWWEALAGGAVQREWMANIARRTAAQRLAHLLSELHCRLAMVGHADDASFACPLTQVQFANACAMTVEHANRTLRKLRDLFGIETQSGHILFGDLASTREFAGFDEAYIKLNDGQDHMMPSMHVGSPQPHIAAAYS